MPDENDSNVKRAFKKLRLSHQENDPMDTSSDDLGTITVYSKESEAVNKAKFCFIDSQRNLRLLVPISSGNEVGLDNTCESNNELKKFLGFSHNKQEYAVTQLDKIIEAINQDLEDNDTTLSQDLKDQMQLRLEQAEFYKKAISEVVTIDREDPSSTDPWETPYDSGYNLDSMSVSFPKEIFDIIHKGSNIFSMAIKPHMVDPNGIPRTEDRNFSLIYPDVSEDTEYMDLQNVFADVLFKEFQEIEVLKLSNKDLLRSAIHKKLLGSDLKNKVSREFSEENNLEDSPYTEFSESDFKTTLDLIQSASGELFGDKNKIPQVPVMENRSELNFKYLTETLGEDTLEGCIDNLLNASSEYFKYATLQDTDPALQDTGPTSHFTDACSLPSGEARADTLSIITQFLLAHIGSHLYEKDHLAQNLGDEIEGSEELQTSIISKIKDSLSPNGDRTDIEKSLIELVNEKLKLNLDTNEINSIKEKFQRNFKQIISGEGAPHYDNFNILLRKLGNFATKLSVIGFDFMELFQALKDGRGARNLTQVVPVSLLEVPKIITKGKFEAAKGPPEITKEETHYKISTNGIIERMTLLLDNSNRVKSIDQITRLLSTKTVVNGQEKYLIKLILERSYHSISNFYGKQSDDNKEKFLNQLAVGIENQDLVNSITGQCEKNIHKVVINQQDSQTLLSALFNKKGYNFRFPTHHGGVDNLKQILTHFDEISPTFKNVKETKESYVISFSKAESVTEVKKIIRDNKNVFYLRDSMISKLYQEVFSRYGPKSNQYQEIQGSNGGEDKLRKALKILNLQPPQEMKHMPGRGYVLTLNNPADLDNIKQIVFQQNSARLAWHECDLLIKIADRIFGDRRFSDKIVLSYHIDSNGMYYTVPNYVESLRSLTEAFGYKARISEQPGLEQSSIYTIKSIPLELQEFMKSPMNLETIDPLIKLISKNNTDPIQTNYVIEHLKSAKQDLVNGGEKLTSPNKEHDQFKQKKLYRKEEYNHLIDHPTQIEGEEGLTSLGKYCRSEEFSLSDILDCLSLKTKPLNTKTSLPSTKTSLLNAKTSSLSTENTKTSSLNTSTSTNLLSTENTTTSLLNTATSSSSAGSSSLSKNPKFEKLEKILKSLRDSLEFNGPLFPHQLDLFKIIDGRMENDQIASFLSDLINEEHPELSFSEEYQKICKENSVSSANKQIGFLVDRTKIAIDRQEKNPGINNAPSSSPNNNQKFQLKGDDLNMNQGHETKISINISGTNIFNTSGFIGNKNPEGYLLTEDNDSICVINPLSHEIAVNGAKIDKEGKLSNCIYEQLTHQHSKIDIIRKRVARSIKNWREKNQNAGSTTTDALHYILPISDLGNPDLYIMHTVSPLNNTSQELFKEDLTQTYTDILTKIAACDAVKTFRIPILSESKSEILKDQMPEITAQSFFKAFEAASKDKNIADNLAGKNISLNCGNDIFSNRVKRKLVDITKEKNAPIRVKPSFDNSRGGAPKF